MSQIQDIQELNLEDVMGDRFGRYSKYIIQDRALPDIRDWFSFSFFFFGTSCCANGIYV